MGHRLAVIGVGNMARAIIDGIISSDISVEKIYLYDRYTSCTDSYSQKDNFCVADSIGSAVAEADYVLLSVKPQNYGEVLDEIAKTPEHSQKLYISIGAGITVDSVSTRLGNAPVVRVLPNLPMTIGKGVSAICKNESVAKCDFDFVESLFLSSGNAILIDEEEMNRIIGVTSSSPAYVFKFIDAICKGAQAQGLDGSSMLDAVCDVVIGSALLLKQSEYSPAELIAKVASKGGTTEQALLQLNEAEFDDIIKNAMCACTRRADELGKQ